MNINLKNMPKGLIIFLKYSVFHFLNATIALTKIIKPEILHIIKQIVEPQPPENMMDIPGMQDEMRRPMMLIVSANKKMDR